MSKKPVVFISSALTSRSYDESKFFEFFIIIIGKLSVLLRSRQYELILRVPEYQEDAVEEQKEFLDDLTKDDLSKYSALIISPFERQPLVDYIDQIIRRNKEFPILTIDKDFRKQDFIDKAHIINNNLVPKSVICDEEFGGELAARSIIDCMYDLYGDWNPEKEPYIQIFKGLEGSELRVKGFRKGMEKLCEEKKFSVRICCEEDEINAQFKRTTAKQKAKILLTDLKCDVQAFFCCNDEMALGVRDELERRFYDLRIERSSIDVLRMPPDSKKNKLKLLDKKINMINDIKIVGFDGIRETRILTHQKDNWLLNSVDVKIVEQANNLSKLLFYKIGEIKKPKDDEIKQKIPPKLIVPIGDQKNIST